MNSTGYQRFHRLLAVVLSVVMLLSNGIAPAMASCTHEHVVTHKHIRATSYAQKDAYTHYITGDEYTHVDCMDCSYSSDPVLTQSGITSDEKHNFDATTNACVNCGYQTDCLHTNTTVHTYMEDVTYTDNKDGATHTTEGYVRTMTSCLACGAILSENLSTTKTVTTDGHHMLGDGCDFCGYKSGCQHTNTKKDIHPNTDYIVSADDATHTYGGALFETVYCFDCNSTISITAVGEEGTNTTGHHYVDGVCTYCKHVCGHSKTTERSWDDNYRYEKVDENEHKFIYDSNYAKTCDYCHTVIDETHETKNNNEGHEWVNGACKWCGEERICAHENTRTERWDEVISQDPGDNDGHVVTYKRIEETFCADCNVLLERKEGEAQTNKMPHYFDGDTCRECQYVIACTHENTHTNVWNNPIEYTAVQADTHTVRRHEYTETWCKDCNGRLGFTEKMDQTVTEPHDFSKGNCPCGQANTCQHANMKVIETREWHILAATDNNDGRTHLAIITDLMERKQCQDCGYETDWEEAANATRSQENLPHSYDDNGKCWTCGYQNACTNHDLYVNSWWDKEKYTDNQDGTHTVTGTYYSEDKCKICGQTFNFKQEQNKEVTAAHDFSYQHCECGAENPCNHDDYGRRVEVTVENVTGYAPKNDTVHIKQFTARIKEYCDGCDQETSSHREDGHSADENHNFQNGACKACGNPDPAVCAHNGSTSTQIQVVDTKYSDYQGDTHTRIVTEDHNTVCDACKKVIDTQTVTLPGVTEAHDFTKGDCACSKTNTCDHADTRTIVREENIRYPHYDGESHEKCWKEIDVKICNTCGYEEKVGEKDRQEWKEHVYVNGACPCGLLDPAVCSHEKTFEASNRYNEKFVFIDADTHQVTYDYKEMDTCEKCHQEVKVTLENLGVTGTEGHRFDGAVCYACGYSTCAHEFEVIGTHEWFLISATDNGDGKTHLAIFTTAVQKQCKLCNYMTGPEVVDPTDRREQNNHHDYNDNGKCYSCGYQNICTHGKMRVESWWNNDVKYTDNGNGTHTVTGDRYTQDICEFCMQRFNYSEEKNLKITEEHDFTTSKCQCDATNVCDHEGYGRTTKENVDKVTGVESKDTDNHIKYYRAWIREFCENCGQEMRSYIEEGHSTEEAHNFQNGECIICGTADSSVCQHTGDTELVTEVVDTRYSAGDTADQHIRIADEVRTTLCKDCKFVLDTQTVTLEGVNEAHDFSKGNCVCGQQNTCQHDGETEEIVDRKNCRYNDITLEYHYFFCDQVVTTICAACGYVMGTENQYDVYVEDPHTFVNGECDCGQIDPDTCDHQIKEEIIRRNVETTSIDSMKHSITYNEWVEELCNLCGKVFDEYVGKMGVTEEEAHRFSDGDDYFCWDCGYSTCQHEFEILEKIEVWTFNAVDNKDGKTHHAQAGPAEYKHCNKCGYQTIEIVAGATTWEDDWNHSYDGDRTLCMDCGYVDTCQHSIITETWYEATGYEKVDEKTHIMLGDKYTYMHCEICDRWFGDSQELDQRVEEAHDFTNGDCPCGQQNNCQHEFVVTDASREVISATDNGDGRTHTAIVTDVERKQCTICKYETDWEETANGYRETYNGDHYYDENGVCWACGYQNTCTNHDFYVNSWWAEEEYTDNQNGTHTVIGILCTEDKCKICAQTFNYKEEHNKEVTEAHDFSYQHCECGAENPCNHDDYDHNVVVTVENVTGYTPKDTAYHTKHFTARINEYCDGCGQELASYPEDDHTTDEAHNFQNGVCDICGGADPAVCQHPETTVEKEWVSSSYSNVQDETHVRIDDEKQTTICAECKTIIKTETVTLEGVTEPHDFSQGDCACGKENTCGHTERKKVVTIYNVSYPGMNQEGHDKLYDEKIALVCALCNYEISAEINENCGAWEEHTYENGVCDCGAPDPANCNHSLVTQTDERNKVFESVDAETHFETFDIWEVEFCEDCGYLASETLITAGATDTRGHAFDGSTCVLCGYSDHTHQFAINDEWMEQKDCFEIDDMTHSVTEVTMQYKQCDICGYEIVEQVAGSENTFTTDHYFEGGECRDCGYVNQCQHENTDRNEYLSFEPGDVVYSNITATEHTGTGLLVWEIYCLDCNEMIDNGTEDNVTRTEEHYFLDDACYKCGEAAADEPTATPTPVPPAPPTEAPTAAPTEAPTVAPTAAPTATPTKAPTVAPTVAPTEEPTVEPTEEPTVEPTVTPEPPVIQPEKVENQTIDVFVEDVIDEITADVEGVYEVIVPVEPLKEVVNEETFSKIEELKPEEKIVVLLVAMADNGNQDSPLMNQDLVLSDETAAVIEDVSKAVASMNADERKAFEEMIEETFPSQEVEVDGKVYVYYLIPVEIKTESGVEIRYYAFCYDEEQKTWMFTVVDANEDISDILVDSENLGNL